jgi:heptaprenyl diphosphate synthase
MRSMTTTVFAEQVARQVEQLADGLPGSLREPAVALARRHGKGLRPMLVAACAAFGTPDATRLVRLGAVVELMHLASLLHDDVIDRAAIRRDLPAAHVTVGAERAALAGLGCFALAGTEAAALGHGVDKLAARTAAELASGQLLDTERAFDTELSVPAYLELAGRKTGALFRLCCLLGAAEAAVEPGTGRALAGFGAEFGVAFQVLDDCLEFTPGSGKPAGTDHKLGLFGVPTLYALAADQSGELARLVLGPELGDREMAAVRELVTALGGLDAGLRLARERYDQALGQLSELESGPREELVALAASVWRDAG